MSAFAALHCKWASLIFRTSIGFSVPALAIRQKASAHMPVWAARRPVFFRYASLGALKIDDAASKRFDRAARAPAFRARRSREEIPMLKSALLVTAGIVLG